MTSQRLLCASVLVLIFFLTLGCNTARETWVPPAEEETTSFLQYETTRVLENIEAANRFLDSSPAEARQSLRRAHRHLERLSHYYLPLLEAREFSHNAYRFYVAGQTREALQAINRVEEILLEVANREGEHVSQALETPIELCADAKLSLQGEGKVAAEVMDTLSMEVNQLLLKADLILQNNE